MVVMTEASLDMFTPQNAKAALESTEAERWIAAMQREKECHIKNRTFGPVMSLSREEKIIPADWLYKIKHRGAAIDSQDLTDKQFKARVVIRGQFMKQGVNFNDTFAPVAKAATLRALLAVAAKHKCLLFSGDVETAFLTAEMDCDVYVRMPPYWGSDDGRVAPEDTQVQIRKLLKGVPGIPQGSRLFHQTFTKHLGTMGFKPSKGDNCLFFNAQLSERNAVLIWVDDFILMCQSLRYRDEFIKDVRARFTVNIFGELQSFLGMEILRDIQKQYLQLNQANTVRVLLERAKMSSCNAASNPCVTGTQFTKQDCPMETENNPLTKDYRSLIALLNFISCWTRPDVAFTVNKLCKFMGNPGETHWKQLKHLIRYMAGTQEWGLSFDMSGSKEQGLLGYSDSSFGDCPDTGRSTLAYVFLYQNATLSWYSKLNTFVTLSTNHAEYAALAIAAREAEWLVTLFDELEPGLPTTPVPINVDNTGVVSLVFNPVDHATNKHVKLSCHYARELTERKIIFPVRVASTNNLADLFTKALPPPTFNSFARQVVQPKIETRTIMLMQAHSEQSPRTKQTSRRNPNNTSTRQKLPSPTLSQSPTQAAHQVETKSEPKGKISLAPPTPTLTCMGCHSISSPQYCMITCANAKPQIFSGPANVWYQRQTNHNRCPAKMPHSQTSTANMMNPLNNKPSPRFLKTGHT